MLNDSNPGPAPAAAAANSTTPLADKYNNLTQDQKDDVLSGLEEKYRNAILTKPNDKSNIQNILSRNYNGDLLRGGKRKTRCKRKSGGKRKTMKKRARRTMKRRHHKGGYVYSSSKELDKASSIVSTPSESLSTSPRRRRKTKKN
jgi:hypothetical protein